MCLAQRQQGSDAGGARTWPAALLSQVKHSTTESLCSNFTVTVYPV